MKDTIRTYLDRYGRASVVLVSLAVAFVLSIELGERGLQFDLEETSVSATESSGEDASASLSNLKIFNRALLKIKDNYVEPDRVEPGAMLESALDEIQRQLPEVVFDYRRSEDGLTAVSASVDREEKTFDLGGLESLWEMSFRLKSIVGFVEEHTSPGPEKDFRDIEYAAINGILSDLDPHSTLLTPKHYEEMKTQTGGEFGGLGIVISIRDGQLTVISPIDGTPAAGKGIRAKDKIVRIGDRSTINMKLNEAVQLLRGEPGTEIDIWVGREGWNEPRKFTITRDVIEIQSVNSEPLAEKVGYIRIKNFQSNTLSDFKSNLKKLKERMGGMEGLVLDLRDNPGGLLGQAIKVSDLFLEEGTIVSTMGAGEKMRDKKVASAKGTESEYPLVVLVNAGSASAAEIVSGSLQNHDRALVMGERTFGKGTVQVMYEFPDDSALKLTVAEYLTPGGVSIQSRGIRPDVRLIPAYVGEEPGSANLFLSDNILREQDLEGHLANGADSTSSDEGGAFVRYLRDRSREEDERFEDPNAFERDFQIDLAERLLAETESKSGQRDELIESFRPILESAYERQMEELRKLLAERFGVDWSSGPSPDQSTLELDVSTDPSGPVRAGESMAVEATMTNDGDEPIYRAKAITQSANSVLDDREFLFGRLGPGESSSWRVSVDIPKDTESRHELVEFQISDERTNYGDPRRAPVELRSVERPKFGFSYAIHDESGDGVLQVGESVRFETHLTNTGSAASSGARAFLRNQSGDDVYLETGRAEVERIEAGSRRAVDFDFRVENRPDDGNVDVEVGVYDSTFREYVERTFEIPFGPEDGGADEAGGALTVDGAIDAYPGASDKFDPVARLSAGSTVPVVGRTDAWFRVDLGRQTGWIAAEGGSYDAGASAQPPSDVSWRSFQSPTFDVRPAKGLTSSSEVEIEGEISDNTSVKDFYIFVYHRDQSSSEIESRKVAYRSVGEPSIDLSESVPLFEGMNRISLVARDEQMMTARETIYVYRK